MGKSAQIRKKQGFIDSIGLPHLETKSALADFATLIEVISKTDPLTVTKNENKWNAEKSGKIATLDEPTANRLLAAFNPLEASGFLSEEEQKEFKEAKDKTIIRVSGDGDKNIATINLFEKNNDWWQAF